MSRIYDYYNSLNSQTQEQMEYEWQEHLLENDWGSGEDKIKITDNMFFEFVAEKSSAKEKR